MARKCSDAYLHIFYRTDSAALNSRKNSYIGGGLNVSGIRGAITQGLTRAQHSAMDVRKSFVGVAIGDGSRRGSVQAWRETHQRENPKTFENVSDDVGCLSDFAGTEAGEDPNILILGTQDWNQQQANEGIQIVVQEHVDNRWDGTRLSDVPQVANLQDHTHPNLSSQSRRGKLRIFINKAGMHNIN